MNQCVVTLSSESSHFTVLFNIFWMTFQSSLIVRLIFVPIYKIFSMLISNVLQNVFTMSIDATVSCQVTIYNNLKPADDI